VLCVITVYYNVVKSGVYLSSQMPKGAGVCSRFHERGTRLTNNMRFSLGGNYNVYLIKTR